MNTFNGDPEIVEHDDISTIHREDPEFTHCMRIYFKEPFFEGELEDADQNRYDECQEAYETYAFDNCIRLEVEGIFLETAYDWRDEGELWFRYNLAPSYVNVGTAILSRWASGDFKSLMAIEEDGAGEFALDAEPKEFERIVKEHGDTIEEFAESDELLVVVAKAYDEWLREHKEPSAS